MFRSLARLFHNSKGASSRPRRHQAVRLIPAVEALEDRCVPSTSYGHASVADINVSVTNDLPFHLEFDVLAQGSFTTPLNQITVLVADNNQPLFGTAYVGGTPAGYADIQYDCHQPGHIIGPVIITYQVFGLDPNPTPTEPYEGGTGTITILD